MVEDSGDWPGEDLIWRFLLRTTILPLKQNTYAENVADDTKGSEDDKEDSANPELDIFKETFIDLTVAEVTAM